MKETVVTCDHCGKKLDDMKDYPDTEFDTINDWFRADLCSECYTEISNIIKQFVKGKTTIRSCENCGHRDYSMPQCRECNADNGFKYFSAS